MCVCTVNNTVKRLNEANVLILRSHIPGAGLGLFLRPTPPSGRPLVIPEGKYICVYSQTPTRQQVDDVTSTDYLLEVGRRRLRFNAETFTGEEMGRFVNQGGLVEGLEVMCRNSDVRTGATSYAPHEANQIIHSLCNVRYRSHGLTGLNVVANRRLVSTEDATELLADYNLDGYWPRYIVDNIDKLGRDSQLVNLVLWALLSVNSCYIKAESLIRKIPQDLVEKYRNARCPVQLSRHRRH